MTRRASRALALLAAAAILGTCVWLLQGMAQDLEALQAGRLSFRVVLSPGAEEGIRDLGLETPLTGRLYVIVSRDGEEEPRLQTDLTGVPFWGMDVAGLGAGESVVVADGADLLGYPLASMAELPAGRYHVQAHLNVYTTFPRSDGHTLRMHLNSGAGQNPWRAPGNAHSVPVEMDLDPTTGGEVTLTIDRVIEPPRPLQPGESLQQGNYDDTARVEYVKIRSDVLSEFWGRDMWIGANVLLPAGYADDPDVRYPTLWMQGHFPGGSPPLGFSEDGGGRGRAAGFRDFWLSAEAPRMIAVSIRDANPYYDTSYSVNSANVGPYGDAIHQELMPHLEERYRMIPEGWARVTAGGSTGGWEALALQVFYPDTYGGTWGWCPDPVDFNYYQIVNVYEDANAYWTEYDWARVERPNARRPDGNVRSTVLMENSYERAVGPNSRSAGQWAIWEAVFGPVGPDGYPAPIWDPVTGVIDHDVARYWLDNYDLHEHLRRNWPTLGPKLRGKIHVAVGDMDTYYLEQAVYLLEEFLDGAEDPPAEASVEYGRRKPHCWTGSSPTRPGEDLSNAEFVRIAADHVRASAPPGADVSGWYR